CAGTGIFTAAARPGHRDQRISTRPKPITLSDPGYYVKVERPSRTEKHRSPRASNILMRRKSALGRVSRTHRPSTTVRNCTRDEGGHFEAGSQVQVSSHRKLLSSRAMVVSVAETSGPDPGRQG